MNSRKHLLLIIVFCLSIFAVNAQIKNEILNYVDSTEMLVNNGRNLLAEYLSYSNIEKSQEIYQYLKNETENINTHAFYYNEEVTFQILYQEWDTFLAMATEFNEDEEWICYSYPPSILGNIFNAAEANIEIIENGMELSDLDQEETALINLYLLMIKTRSSGDDYSEKLEEFKQQYPKSKYNDFINNYFWKPDIKAYWSFAAGTTFIFPNLEMKDDFEPNMGGFISIDFMIDKLYFSLFFDGTTLYSKQAFSDSTDSHTFHFHDHEAFYYTNIGVAFGYALLKNKNIHITPYIPLSASKLESTHFTGDDKKNEYQIFNDFSSGIGINSDIKLWQFKLKDRGSTIDSFLSLKIQCGYQFIFSTPIRGFYQIQTGLVWGLGSF